MAMWLCVVPLASALAHHSSAAFDTGVRATLTGTVKSFAWENPHCWISMMVPDGKGGAEEWNLEGGSVSILVRNGWHFDTIVAGDKVKVLISPRKDKAPGGEFYTVLEKNGVPLALNVNKGS
jgi:hypothetical protein